MDQQEELAEDPQQCDLGYFSILNLNFFATDEDIKRNYYSDLCPLYFENQNGTLEIKDINFKEVGEKVTTAYFVLENEVYF